MKYPQSEYVLVVEKLASTTRAADVRYEMESWGKVRRCERDRAMRVALVEFDRCEALIRCFVRYLFYSSIYHTLVLELGNFAARSGLLQLCSAELCQRVLCMDLNLICSIIMVVVVPLWHLFPPSVCALEVLQGFMGQPGHVSVATAHGFPGGDVQDAAPRHLGSSRSTEAAVVNDTVCSLVKGLLKLACC